MSRRCLAALPLPEALFDGIRSQREPVQESGGLTERTNLPVRIGLNSGPVYRRVDINTNMNVSGGGINIAQRFMDCGDAGHILLSKSAADLLHQLGGLGGATSRSRGSRG